MNITGWSSQMEFIYNQHIAKPSCCAHTRSAGHPEPFVTWKPNANNVPIFMSTLHQICYQMAEQSLTMCTDVDP